MKKKASFNGKESNERMKPMNACERVRILKVDAQGQVRDGKALLAVLDAR